MAQIIASTYELQEKIGSGGAGIVYLGQHLRLHKKVVLKADKRTLATKPETLRREVDALKDLSHTYIPQVYDFVEEEGTVYTVMDYIEGESLDKPLQRGERFPQAQVIEWARQLLEALCYLHSRPPHGILHSDIKPANIMRTPQGDIRLIDFNIALALGEEGSVRVGYSRGYASPEHYGIDYSSHRAGSDATELVEGTTQPHQTGSARPRSSTGSSASGQKHSILLDVRSDIYSAGATLYHLLTGVRPNVDARQVPPIHHPQVSPAVSAIICKAMEPDPDRRYQTAQEMLDAFESLHENDPRTRRHKRRVKTAAAALSALFLVGGLCTFTGLKGMERAQAQAAEAARLAEEQERTAKQALAGATGSEAAYQKGNTAEAVRLARDALSLHTAYDARAQRALTEALGVYDLSGGFRPHLLLELPGETMKAALSPEGTRTAAIAGGELLVFDTESGTQLSALQVEESALADFAFVGEDVVVYAGKDALRCYDLSRGEELWSGGAATAVTVSADGHTVAAAYRDDTSATLYDTATGLVRRTVDFHGNRLHAAFNDTFADSERDLFALNSDGSMLAAGFSDGGALWVFNMRNSDEDIQLYDQSAFLRFEGGFCGPYLAFTAWDRSESTFAVIDTVGLIQTGGYAQPMRFRTQADESGIYLSVGRLLSRVEPETFYDTQMAYGDAYLTGIAVNRNGMSAVQDENGQLFAFDTNGKVLTSLGEQGKKGIIGIAGPYVLFGSIDTPELRLWKLDEKPETLLLSYDSAYQHDEARLSGDGETVMLFRYNGFRILDMDGTVLAEVEIPEGEQIYDQQYRRDESGSRLEVTYYSGLVRHYSAKDGHVLSEETVTPPDKEILEDFFTSRFRIERPLHGTPVVYDRESGEPRGELDPEDYLTYVTEVGEYIITEYQSSRTGERYGLLLNGELETVAELPGLCDIFEDGRLIFDDGKGNLRESHIYSAGELLALGGAY